MNAAKERLAFEVTKLVHGEEKALEAQKQAKAAFGGGNAEDMPTVEVENVSTVVDLLVFVGQAKSKGEAKRLIEGGGVSIESTKITDPFAVIPEEFISKKEFVLHKGKKVHIKVIVK
jgi:tyrosyl-tRNA synthetase